MKNKLLFFMVIASILFGEKALAQLPEVSTSASPTWYYIQVLGSENDRENRVFTVEGEKVFGRPIDASKTDAQYWRFEKSGNNYTIINKGTGKKASVSYDSGKAISYISLSEQSTTTFTFASSPGTNLEKWYTIKSSAAPSGGDSSELYAHQANTGGSRDYAVMLVGTSYYNGLNSAFAFVLPSDLDINDASYWYTITSAKNGLSITDVSATSGSGMRLSLTQTDQAEGTQLWKMEKQSNLTHFTNKATGNVIQAQSDLMEDNFLYNFTQLTSNRAESKGFTVSYIGMGQYTISGIEEDGITRYLNASKSDEDPDEFDTNTLNSSGFAWKFSKASSSVSIENPGTQIQDNIKVYSVNRKIVVEGSEKYQVRTIQGILVNGNIELPVGVYLVTVEGKTVKILVK